MISILCPTRNRTAGLSRMWQSALDTADNPDCLELVIYVDHDDEATHKFLECNLPEALVIISNPDKPEIYSNLHNICCNGCTHDIFMSCADDVVFRTNGWDTAVIDEFNKLDDKIGFVYPNDGHHGENLGTHGFFHKNWFNTLGYISPPIFSVDYSDNYIMNIASAIDRIIYLPNVLVEHMHWTFGKSEFDSTAQNAHARRLSSNNHDIFNASQQLQSLDIEKLKKVMYEQN